MAEDFSHLDKKEQLKAENDFIKMKLMLERGASFNEMGNDELPAELEHEFLKNIMAYEEQYEEHKRIRIFDKIGQPQHFKPVAEIEDSDMDKAWMELRNYLNEYGLDLDVCSPHISSKELYRFATEELFQHETDDMRLPGWTTCFIYDEFHPDPVYESERVVKDELLPGLFKTKPVDEYFHCLCDTDIWLNGKLYPLSNDIKTCFNQFKSFFSKIDLKEAIISTCDVINKTRVAVWGNYKAIGHTADGNKETVFDGSFTIELQPDDLGYWSVKSMRIGTITF